MTNFDRSKLARIVAFGLFKDQDVALIEERLTGYANDLSRQEINRAILEGSEARSIASLMSSGHELPAADILAEQQAAGAIGHQVLLRYQVGAPEDDNWRSIAFTALGPQTVETIRQFAEVKVGEAMARQESGVISVVPDSLSYLYVAPLFGG